MPPPPQTFTLSLLLLSPLAQTPLLDDCHMCHVPFFLEPEPPTPDEAGDNTIVVPVRGADDEFRRVMNTWTVKDMRAALKDAGQAHAGNKSELAERLVAHGLHGQRADDIQLIES